MATYRYDKRITIRAINYTDAKRQIEARIGGPMSAFRLEIQMPGGQFSPAF